MPLVRVSKASTSVAGLVAVALSVFAASAATAGTIFQQDFSSSNTVSSYVSATPNSGQWTDIAGNGSVIPVITSGALVFTKTTGGSGTFTRITAFSPVPTAIVYKFRLAVSGNTAAQTNAGVFRVGSGYSNSTNDESDANTYARLGVNFTATNGTFTLRNETGGTNSGNLAGAQDITWAMNNSGASRTYLAPDGSTESVANDRADVWAGTTKLFNDMTVTTAAQTLSNLKFILGNGAGTISIDNIRIYTLPELVATTTQTNVACFGGNNGAIDLTVTGGTSPYTYLWSNSATTQDISGLTAGGYWVRVTDATGDTLTKNVTVTQPTAISPTQTHLNVSCFGGNNGSIDLTVSGGTGAYTYSWSNGATTQDVSGLAAGTYSVTVTDANACTAQLTNIVISQPAVLSLSETHQNVLCFGGANGSIDLTVSGGTAPFTYAWTGGRTVEDPSDLTAGTYDVTVTDANGCTASLNGIVIGEPASAISLSETHIEVVCYGASTGSIDLTVSGGDGPYTFAWTGGATTEDLSDIPAGSYDVTVTDANGCTATLSGIVVGQPSVAFVLSQTRVDVSCFGGSNGSIDLTVSGGQEPFTYAWTGGATTEDLTGLSAGSYDVTVTDANGCVQTLNVVVSEPAEALGLSQTHENVSCFGGNNGSIDITVTGGTAPYTYLWSNSATSQDLSGLSAGTYDVLVTDANGCTANLGVLISEPGAALSLSETNVDVSCFGASTGSIDLTVTGGTSPYTFAWTGGATSEDLSGIPAGTYDVTVTDANGCTASINGIVISEPAAALSLSETHQDAACFGSSTGSIDLTVSGGTGPYTFAWTGGATSEDLSDIPAGSYDVTVTDANGCTSSIIGIVVGEPASTISLSQTHVDVLCFGATSGSIDLTVSGGTSPYTFAWTGGATTEDLTNIGAGSYDVTVTDDSGCSQTLNVVVDGPAAALTLGETNVDVACFGGSNGSIDLTVSGGTGPYTFAWTGGATSEDLSGLSAGSFDVTVTDANGCTASINGIVVSEPGAALSLSETHEDAACFGSSSGSIDLTVTGGTSPYTYAWTGGATSQDLSAIPAGTYDVTVTDANGCTSSINGIVIGEPSSALSLSQTHTDATCNGSPTGSIDLTVSGGTSPYTYAWTGGATSEDLSNIVAGSYDVTVTDANGCTATLNVVVGAPTTMSLSLTPTHVSCNGGANGAVDLTATGGTGPYTFLWTGGATTEDVSGLTAGNYTVVVTDANGCFDMANVDVNQPDAIVVTGTPTHPSYLGATDGAIDATASGGTPPYTYAWTGGATTEDLSNVGSGSYDLTVTDSRGCTGSLSMTLGATTYRVTVMTGKGGAVSPNGVVDVAAGSDATFDITADEGFTIYDVVVDGTSMGAMSSYTFTAIDDDHTLYAQFVDNGNPTVAVTNPNGGEDWQIGQQYDITWSAWDPSGIATVDLELSRDHGATWQTLASGIPNTGSWSWTCDGPPTGTEESHVFSALIQITAHDSTGLSWADSSDAAFSIYPINTATLLARFDVVPADVGVRLEWQFGGGVAVSGVVVERSTAMSGPWQPMSLEFGNEMGLTVAYDRSAAAGQTYWYRLVVTTVSGDRNVFGPMSSNAGAAITAFAMGEPTPNPTPRAFRVEYTVARATKVRLTLLDLQGREVAVLAEGPFSPGRYIASWDGMNNGRQVPTGVYFVRYQAERQQFVRRVVISR